MSDWQGLVAPVAVDAPPVAKRRPRRRLAVIARHPVTIRELDWLKLKPTRVFNL
ncbi:MAG: hypothetical protein GXP06_09115 [Alphaproteobacteria bacterium]|nr:hypothetical protein [Alphaproteobacteria bacterium]